MAYMQLADYRTDLQTALGDRGLSNTILDRHINFAYLDIIGAVKFPELVEEDTSQSTANGVNSVNVPTGAMLVDLVRNTTDDVKLQWIPLQEYWRLTQAAGVAAKWSRQKNKIMLNPVPNGIKALRILYIKSPARLSGSTDVTVLPDTWDSAVFLLSVHFGLLAVGEEDRATVWFQRALAYVQTRMTEEGLSMGASGLGLTLPLVGQKFTAQQAGA